MPTQVRRCHDHAARAIDQAGCGNLDPHQVAAFTGQLVSTIVGELIQRAELTAGVSGQAARQYGAAREV